MPLQRQVKRRKTSPPVWHDSSLTQILTDHSVSDAEAELNVAAKDELVEYLSLYSHCHKSPSRRKLMLSHGGMSMMHEAHVCQSWLVSI